MVSGSTEIATEHPYIVRTEGIHGGRPYIRQTGLSVELIVRLYRMGATPEELLSTYPQLTPAALYDALSYYHDHAAEIDQALQEAGSLEQIQAKYDFSIGEKGKVIFATRPGDG